MDVSKRKRPYGLSCLACRQKKISCDRARPRCSGCRSSDEDCRIPASTRPLRRVRDSLIPDQDLVDRFKWLEDRVRHLEELNDVACSSPEWESGPGTHDKLAREPPHHGLGDEQAPMGSELGGAKYRLAIDDTGTVSYHGLTGWSIGPSDNHVLSDIPFGGPSPTTSTNILTVSQMNDPAFAPILKALASSKHISIAPAFGEALLDCYFCHQVFNVIERSSFTRDMALGGPLYSDFLLMTMYASASRMIDGLDVEQRRSQGELFGRLAREHLARELEGPTKMTTIQGLLLLSGRECAHGETSQGWLHAGMAFRMIHDLGIHLAPETVVGSSSLSAEELASRDRVFWSALIWDKSISLAMGREPTFPPRQGRDPSTLLDFDDDEGPWFPWFSNPLNCPPALLGYSYQPKKRVAAFRYHARLSVILHDIIMDLYSSESQITEKQRASVIAKIRGRLDALWADVPISMKFDPLQQCPPPWVVMFQLSYHAVNILLYRPAYEKKDIAQNTGAVVMCLQHSVSAHQLAVSFTSTFGERLTYVAMYSLFVAASFDIILLDCLKYDIQLAALERLATWLAIMEKSVPRVPSIRKSVMFLSQSTKAAVSKYGYLASSDKGRWLASHQAAELHSTLPSPAGPFDGTEAFNFFDLLDPAALGG